MSSTSKARPRLGHVPALDGLRGLAVIGVLLYHEHALLPGGYLGVDLFFVLSGFLITALLLHEHQATGRIDLKAFWIRRARRLFPALGLLMLGIAGYARWVAAPGDVAQIRGDALATVGYVANWRSILSDRSYWEMFASPSPLEHTWSLAIEEQFYVVWPLLVVGAMAFFGRYRHRLLLWVTLVLAGASALAMAYLGPVAPSRAYLGTDCRAVAILLGAAMAMVVPFELRASRRQRQGLDALGLVAILGLGAAWCWLRGESPFLYRGGFWLSELAALVVIACAICPGSVIGRVLAWSPLRMAGRLSYGLYLYHVPINLMATDQRLGLTGAPAMAARVAAVFAVAYLSLELVEQPLRQGSRSRRVVPVSLSRLSGLAALVVVAGFLLWGTMPRPGTFEQELVRTPRPPDHQVEHRIMMLGDSTANSLGWVIRGFRDPQVSVDLRGQDGCSLSRLSCNGEAWRAYHEESQPTETVLVVSGAFLYGATLDGGYRNACHPAWDAQFEDNLERRLRELSELRTRAWVATVPYALAGYDTDHYRRLVDCNNASIRRAASRVPGVNVLDLADMLCTRDKCTRRYEGGNGRDVRPDGVHYDIYASLPLARALLSRLVHDERS